MKLVLRKRGNNAKCPLKWPVFGKMCELGKYQIAAYNFEQLTSESEAPPFTCVSPETKQTKHDKFHVFLMNSTGLFL
jgi:hypothetical protein